MNLKDTRTSRRAFFLNGGAALGAGVAATAGAAMLSDAKARTPDQGLQQQLATAADREAIRQLHVAFTSLIEQHGYEATGPLFHARASVAMGGSGVTHGAYRANALQQQDSLEISRDGKRAIATWHVDVAVGTPLHGDSTAAQMARLQGQLADRRWESGRIEAQYVKSSDDWKIASLDYLPA